MGITAPPIFASFLVIGHGMPIFLFRSNTSTEALYKLVIWLLIELIIKDFTRKINAITGVEKH